MLTLKGSPIVQFHIVTLPVRTFYFSEMLNQGPLVTKEFLSTDPFNAEPMLISDNCLWSVITKFKLFSFLYPCEMLIIERSPG